MKLFHLFLVLLPSLTLATEKAILSFSDGSSFSAVPSLLNAESQEITLTAPSLRGEVTLDSAQLRQISLQSPPEHPDLTHYAVATIADRYSQKRQDTIRGELISLDDQEVTISTWYAGELKLDRRMVTSLDIQSYHAPLFRGPKGPEGWITSEGEVTDSWKFDGLTMQPTSNNYLSIAREIPSKKRMKISLKAEWRDGVNFRVIFLSNDGSSSYADVGYTLQYQQSYLHLKWNSGRANRLLRERRNRDRQPVEKVHLTIYFSQDPNEISAVYDGEDRIGTWNHREDFEDGGDWMHLAVDGQNKIRFSDIVVQEWDGQLPHKPAELEDENLQDDLEGQNILLRNGDVVVGNLGKIEDGLASLTTSYGDLRLPINRMTSVTMTGKKAQPRMEPKDVRAWFHEGGFVTVELDEIRDGLLKGQSQVFGQAAFKLNAFSRIDFDIYNKKKFSSAKAKRDW